MKRALPTNSVLFIRVEDAGMKRLKTKPQKKAPRMPSMPQNSATAAARNTMASTKMYCMILSVWWRKNHRMILGKMRKIMAMRSTNLKPSHIHSKTLSMPRSVPEMMASTIRAKTRASMVAVTLMTTL